MQYWRSIWLSILLHGLVVALLFLSRSLEPFKDAPPSTLVVELPLLPSDNPRDQDDQGRNGGRGGSKAKKSAQRPAKLPRHLSLGNADKIWQQPSRENVPSSARIPGEEVDSFSRSMDVAGEGKFHPFAKKIYDRLDSYLGYPIDFIEEYLQGPVTLHFLVDSRGRFTGKFLEAQGEDKFLLVYSMAMVALALKEPIPGLTGVREGEFIPIAVQVDYRLILPDGQADLIERRHYKNSMLFQRFARTEPKPTKVMRRFISKYMPPIIPVPGGFFIDFVQLYKMVTEKDSDDPKWKRGIRLELDHQMMEQVIKNSTS